MRVRMGNWEKRAASNRLMSAPVLDCRRGDCHLLSGHSGGLRGYRGQESRIHSSAAATRKLPNLRGVHARVESLTDTYDVVSSRAFASLVISPLGLHRR